MDRPVELRGHHLLCLQFFAGEGYSPEYVENLERLLSAAETDGVVVVTGADGICLPCPSLSGSACERERDAVVWDDVRDRLPDVLEAWYAGACDGCSWLDVCTHSGLCELCESADLDAEAALP